MRNEAAVAQVLGLGAARVIIGTAAVRDPQLVERLVEHFGDAIIVGVDARGGQVATEGWLETASLAAADLVQRMAALGVRRVAYTDISRDGTLSEPNYEATAELIAPGGPAIIASGGVASTLQLLRLAEIGCEAAIVGRALYTGDVRLPEAIRALTTGEAV
jgi:phosphoribosylformimino-5-aminoimidazole carboxamide ribotide isomerase